MDPYFSSRVSRAGSYSQSGYGFMNNLFDQNAFPEESFSQGPRLNLPGSIPYHQSIDSERNIGMYGDPHTDMTNDQFMYDKYMSLNIASVNSAIVNNTVSLNEPDEFGTDRKQNRNSSMLTIINTENVSPIPRLPSSQSNNSGAGRNKVEDFSLQFSTDSTVTAAVSNSKQNHNTYTDIARDTSHFSDMPEDYNEDSLEAGMAERITTSDDDHHAEQVEKSLVSDHVSAIVDETCVAESAVDLSKTSISNDIRDKLNEHVEDITETIKQELCEEIETLVDNNDSDDDKTIIDEPIKKKHIKSDKKEMKCEQCGKVYASSSSFKKHQNMHAGIFKCSICNKSWSSNYALTQHEKVHSGEREGSLCNICGKTFFDTSSLKKHHKSVHDGIKTFACDKCDLKFYARKTLVEHIRVHTGERPFKCKFCPKTYKRISDLNHHIRGHTGETKHVCDICGKGVRRLSELKVHKNQHRGDVVHVKRSQLVCSWCGKVFKNQEDLNRHTKDHFKDVMQKEYDQNVEDSLVISAALDSKAQALQSDMHLTLPDRMNILGKKTGQEMASFKQAAQKSYQHDHSDPQQEFHYTLDSHLPVSDAGDHAYYPLPAAELDVEQTEPGEVFRKNQEISEQTVSNWLNRHFSSKPDTQPNESKSAVNQLNKNETLRNVNMDINDPQSDNVTPTDSDNTAKIRDSFVVPEKGEKNSAKTNVAGEKQKSIATVVDFLVGKKAKDLTNLEPIEENEVKMEFSDGGETDDYDIKGDAASEVNEETKPSKKHSQKGKVVKKQTKKIGLKSKTKSKASGKRQRKKTPKKLQAQTGDPQKDKIQEASEKLDNQSIKSEKEAVADEFPLPDRHEMKDGMHLCTECGKTFKTRSAHKKHQEMHNGLYTCSQCNRSLSSSWSLRQHMLTHTSIEERAKYPCNVCDKLFCDKSSMKKHVRAVHMNFKPFKCSECDLAFSERKTMNEHIRTHTGERPFLCMYCPKTFKRVSELNHHIRGHTGETKHTCDTCGRGYRRLSELLRHVTIHTQEKPHQCNICGKDFRSFSVMREHHLRHLGNTGKYTCPRCGRKYFKKSHLERHLRSDRDCTKCKYCLMHIQDPVERERHQASHDGVLKYLCTVCGKHFRGRGPLNKHVKIHSQERSYVCEQCGASFIQSNHLKQHVRTHTGEKPYVCLMCGKSFAQSGTLYSHTKTHVSEPAEMKTAGGYHCGYGSEDSEEDEIKNMGAIREPRTLIETKVA